MFVNESSRPPLAKPDGATPRATLTRYPRLSFQFPKRAWRALKTPLVEAIRYQTPRHLRFLDWLAKCLVPVWLFLTGWLGYALVAQVTEPIPEVTDANARRGYFYAIGLTITALGALLVAPLVFIRTFVSDRQAQAVEEQRDIGRQTHFTTLYSKAIDQLGANATVTRDGAEETAPAIDIRIGAVYSLQRIATQSDADYRPTIETLCAYVRNNSGPAIEQDPTESPPSSKLALLMQRRSLEPDGPETKEREAREAFLAEVQKQKTALHDAARAIRQEVGGASKKLCERPDVRTALHVLMRRPSVRRTLEGYSADTPPDLITVDWFEGIDFAAPDSEFERMWAEANERASDKHRESQEIRLANVPGFMKRMASWMTPEQDDAWRLDLSGAVLQGLTGDDIDFSRFLLHGVRLEGAELYRARLQGADLEGARLEGAFLQRPDLRGANLQWALLDGIFTMGANLDGADLLGARMRGADLDSAEMAGAQLDGVRAEGANFTSSHLEGAYFGAARMQGANFRGADLEGVKMGHGRAQRRLMNLGFAGAAHLVPNAERENTHLARAMMAGFSAANFAGARFENADLHGAQMDEAFLEDADFTGASLRAADLSLVGGLTQQQVDAAFGDGSVELPDGIVRPAHWPSETLNDTAYYGRFRNWIESQPRPWPHAPVFGFWEAVPSIPFARPADSDECISSKTKAE